MEPVVLFVIMALLLFGPRRKGMPGPFAKAVGAFFLAWMLAMFAMGKVWSAIFGRVPQPEVAFLWVQVVKRCTAALVVVCSIAFSIPATAQELVRHPTAGIELLRPAGWHDATLADVQANRARVRLSDPQLERALQTRSALPLLVFAKLPLQGRIQV